MSYLTLARAALDQRAKCEKSYESEIRSVGADPVAKVQGKKAPTRCEISPRPNPGPPPETLISQRRGTSFEASSPPASAPTELLSLNPLLSHSVLSQTAFVDPTPGIVLDRDGLPGWPCATCDSSLFWCPADVPPAWGPWRCEVCEPRPAEMLVHAVSVPTGGRA